MAEAHGFTVRYEGQSHQMELDTLVASLMNLASLTRNVSSDLVREGPVEIRVSAPERGSFQIDLQLLAQSLPVIAPVLASYAPLVIHSILDFLQIKKLLRGEKPDRVERKGNTTIIVKGNANVVVAERVFQFYSSNHDANADVNRLFAGLVERPEVEGLAVEASGIGTFRVAAEEFPGMAARNALIDEREEREVVRADLIVVKLVFTPKRTWEFVYCGIKISARIEDESFWRKVDSCDERFGKGDILVADLEIMKEYDSDLRCWMNKTYRVIAVHGHRVASRQIRMSDA